MQDSHLSSEKVLFFCLRRSHRGGIGWHGRRFVSLYRILCRGCPAFFSLARFSGRMIGDPFSLWVLFWVWRTKVRFLDAEVWPSTEDQKFAFPKVGFSKSLTVPLRPPSVAHISCSGFWCVTVKLPVRIFSFLNPSSWIQTASKPCM